MNVDVKTRYKPIFRRPTSSSVSAQLPLSASTPTGTPLRDRARSKVSFTLSEGEQSSAFPPIKEDRRETDQCRPSTPREQHQSSPDLVPEHPEDDARSPSGSLKTLQNPRLIVERPTPERGRSLEQSERSSPPEAVGDLAESSALVTPTTRPTIAVRRHSPIPDGEQRLFSAFYIPERPIYRPPYPGVTRHTSTRKTMAIKKVWVKRSGSSATQVPIGEDDLVDDVRDMVIRKFANSLGRNFDSPDINLRLVQRKYSARHSNHERLLGPEEIISKLIDVYYPGGQTIEEALVIDIPQRRTPKHSPRISLPYYMADSLRPGENGSDYFPPMSIPPQHSPQMSSSVSNANNQTAAHRSNPHSIAVLETGHVPDLPSPGSRLTRHSHRPKNSRQHTSSPTVMSGSSASQNHDGLKNAKTNPLHTPPISSVVAEHGPHGAVTPPARTSSPRLQKLTKRNRKPPADNGASPSTLLDIAVPPINVLIVEDNIINLKLLEAFLKRLKVRWSTAMNGRDAVSRWRAGGFHLVLMDIQLPIMNGLDATKEIRRLERVNDIGVFSNTRTSVPVVANGKKETVESETGKSDKGKEDKLENIALFKSSVIIVALTASSLQSDRHEALAAGCNDFLTKPVSFDWLSRKVMEWGCMQALIDFDGWRKWKAVADSAVKSTSTLSPTSTASANQPSTSSPLATTASASVKASDASARSTSPTTSRSQKSSPSGSSAPSSNNAAGTGNVAGSGRNKFASHVLNGISEGRSSDETDHDTGTGEGTGTDTNGEEGSGTEITVGA